LVCVETHETRASSFYDRAGLELLQEVISFELDPNLRAIPTPGALQFRYADPNDDQDLADLMKIDSTSFPWLWRNSPSEFAEYAVAGGVELHIGVLKGEAVAYIGITAFLGWGHLDRIAVVPEAQGLGLGLEALSYAAGRLASVGAKR